MQINVIDLRTRNELPIVFRRKMGWKAVRRAFVAVCDHKARFPSRPPHRP